MIKEVLLMKKIFFFILLDIMLLAGCGSADISPYQSEAVQEKEAKVEDNLTNVADAKEELLLEAVPENENEEDTTQE